MADIIIRTKASLAKVTAYLRDLPGILSGRLPDKYGIAVACNAVLIKAALEDVHADFDRKSQGGAGEDGMVWEPLHPYTIRRRSLQKGISGQPGRRKISDQDYKWLRQTKKDIYLREFRRLLAGGVEKKEAQRQAAIVSRFLTKGAGRLATRRWAFRASQGPQRDQRISRS